MGKKKRETIAATPYGCLNFGRWYWPKVSESEEKAFGAVAEHFADAASIWVAESMINDPPFLSVDYKTGEIECFLWSVGGDCVMAQASLEDIVGGEVRGFCACLRSAEQIAEAKQVVSRMKKTLQRCLKITEEALLKIESAEPVI